MNVPLLDLKAQYRKIKDEVNAAVREVFDTQIFINGPKVRECEEAVAGYVGSAHCVGVSSGSDALLISLMAEGIGRGDEVITSPYTFFATAGAVARLGARPVFVDIDPRTFNLNPELVKEKISDHTRAIIPVHLFGQSAEMAPITALAREKGLVLIEDAAQAIGSEYQGERVGRLGEYGCFSFFPSKNLGGAGDGGMVAVQDSARADKLRALRSHGGKRKYYFELVGGNFRLDALQAAVVTVKLKYLDRWAECRRSNAARYDRMFSETCLVQEGVIGLPEVVVGHHVFNQYVIRVPRRDELRDHLRDKGIGHEVYYPVPLHLQKCFEHLGYREGDMPESERAAKETIALPIYPELTADQIEYVVESVAAFYVQ